ncbi:hypothetical protein CJJ07_002195 [Candidozyma auris]|nr:hypothetical protein CJJ07_002195 [[Candida] auris]QEL59349.1 hypothetical protein CJJ09_001424 [[Candida] auris]
MGIADLWPVVSPACDPRVPFPIFLSKFIDDHGRPPRFAIDAYMFMFYSQLPDANPEDQVIQERVIRNFMAKLFYFVQHNVSFVVVFDGKFKPSKLRHGHIPEIPGSVNYDEILHHFHRVHSSNYNEGSSLVERLKKILQRNCMDIVQAPGEAEAECAWLQKLGVVDYVISDDSDTLVFGATKMIRLFNRVKYMNEEGKPVLSNTDYYVTPVYMEKVTEATGLDKNRMVLLAVLRGGDYSTGAEGIGITRAKEIALCGTNLLSSLPRKSTQDFGSLPDFSKMFVETFVDQEKAQALSLQNHKSLKSELDRADSLRAFNKYLDSFLREQHKDVFGRSTTMKSEVKVDDYYALLYFFPLVNRKVFKFTPYSTSFGELKAIDDDMPGLTPDDSTQTVKRYNYVCDPGDIGESIVKQGKFIFVGKGRGVTLKVNEYALPRERKFNLKSFALKLLKSSKVRSEIILARSRIVDGAHLGVLKFQRTRLHDKVYLVTKNGIHDTASASDNNGDAIGDDQDNQDPDALFQQNDNDDEDKLIEVFVTMNSIRLVAPDVVKEFERRQLIEQRRKSPSKKKYSPQKTTLDRIWPELSPTKKRPQSVKVINVDDDTVEHESPTKTKSTSSPSKKRSPRKQTLREKYEINPNQVPVTSFFQQRKDPFVETRSLFVTNDDSGSDNDAKIEKNCMKMKNIIADGPTLAEGTAVKAPVESRLSSPESSPSKKSRMNLSPDTSPMKAKKLPTKKDPFL